MIAPHLPALQVIIALLGAPLCLLFGRGYLAWLVALIASWLSLTVAVVLFHHTLTIGPIDYAMGGWAPPWGIELAIDPLNAFVLLLIGLIGAVVLPYAKDSVEHEIGPDRAHLFYAAFLLCLAGLLGITATGDAFNLFVFLEISSLSSYILIAMGGDRRALTSSFQYLVMGTIGGTFVLIAVGFMYAATGTLNMADLAERLPEAEAGRTVHVALAFLVVGVSLKLALFPLHLWLPNAYTYAPSVATVFLSATATKVAVYVLLRFLFLVFGVRLAFAGLHLGIILGTLALLAIFFASVSAIFQDNVKRMFAYSSVAQIGYIVLGIALVSTAGLMAGILHLFNHALAKGAIFMALGCVVYRLRSVHLDSMAGLGRQMPWTMAAFVIGGLSLIGVPLTVGFISKWYLVIAALEQGLWPVAALVLGGSLLAVVYVWRVIETAYLQPAPGGGRVREAPLSMLIPTWVLTLANLYFGIEPSLTVGGARRAAELLLGAGP